MLCCEAIGTPRPMIEWSRAEHSTGSLLGFQENGCLHVNEVKDPSEDNYICRATNLYGAAETTTVVITGFAFYMLFINPFQNVRNGFYAYEKNSFFFSLIAQKLRLGIILDTVSSSKITSASRSPE